MIFMKEYFVKDCDKAPIRNASPFSGARPSHSCTIADSHGNRQQCRWRFHCDPEGLVHICMVVSVTALNRTVSHTLANAMIGPGLHRPYPTSIMTNLTMTSSQYCPVVHHSDTKQHEYCINTEHKCIYNAAFASSVAYATWNIYDMKRNVHNTPSQ